MGHIFHDSVVYFVNCGDGIWVVLSEPFVKNINRIQIRICCVTWLMLCVDQFHFSGGIAIFVLPVPSFDVGLFAVV